MCGVVSSGTRTLCYGICSGGNKVPLQNAQYGWLTQLIYDTVEYYVKNLTSLLKFLVPTLLVDEILKIGYIIHLIGGNEKLTEISALCRITNMPLNDM